jgi:hypothetical protein
MLSASAQTATTPITTTIWSALMLTEKGYADTPGGTSDHC